MRTYRTRGGVIVLVCPPLGHHEAFSHTLSSKHLTSAREHQDGTTAAILACSLKVEIQLTTNNRNRNSSSMTPKHY